MGRLEGELLDAMVALCRDEPACERHMFLLPVGGMDYATFLAPAGSFVRAGDVVLVRREDDPASPPGWDA